MTTMNEYTNSERLPISTLSILIPTLTEREYLFQKLISQLEIQIARNGVEKSVEIISLSDDRTMSIGEKRNRLIELSQMDYVAFIDDDDLVHSDYVGLVYRAIQNKPDVVGIVGEITIIQPPRSDVRRKFYHVISNENYVTSNRGFERPPNHINPMKRSIASRYKFPEKNFGEDTDWAMELSRSGIWKRASQTFIPEVIYFYRFNRNKY